MSEEVIADVPPVVENTTASDFAAIEKELSEASAKLVSSDVTKQIEAAKVKAKEEAAKEFATNQKIIDMEKELQAATKARQELELKSAEQLDSLKTKLNEAISSQAVSTATNPFETQKAEPKTTESDSVNKMIDELTHEEMKQIERESFQALLNRSRS